MMIAGGFLPEQVKIILVRGLEDLDEKTANAIGAVFGVEVFDPGWRTKEPLEDKQNRLHEVVQKIKDEGEIPIALGVSAGAAMVMANMLEYPGEIRHLYSLSGLIDPNLDELDLSHLTATSPGFEKVAQFLTDNLTKEAIERLHLSDKVSAYYSAEDTIVDNRASNPGWIKDSHRVTKGDHLESIIRALVDVRSESDKLNKG